MKSLCPHILFFRCDQWREMAVRLGDDWTYDEVDHLREISESSRTGSQVCVITSFSDPVYWEFWMEKHPEVVVFQFFSKIGGLPNRGMADFFLPSISAEELQLRIQSGILNKIDLRHIVLGSQKMAKNQKIQLELNDRLLRVSVELKEAKDRIEELSMTDALTKLKNRRFFDFQLSRDVLQSSRYKTPLSLFLMDIDNFKKINDTFGHQTGDEVLIRLGEIIRTSLRDTDWAARYGGEEFTVVLPMTGHDGAGKTAERIRHRIENELSHIEGETFTVSIGLATFFGDLTKEELIYQSDSALYRAKQTGKNKVVFFNEVEKEFCEFAVGTIESDLV